MYNVLKSWQVISLGISSYQFTVTLDLGSSRIQLETLGHTPVLSVSVKSCHLCFLPGEPHLL